MQGVEVKTVHQEDTSRTCFTHCTIEYKVFFIFLLRGIDSIFWESEMPKRTPKRIGLIVDSEADPESSICYVLTSVNGRRDWWYVWNPRAGSGRAQVRSQWRAPQKLCQFELEGIR